MRDLLIHRSTGMPPAMAASGDQRHRATSYSALEFGVSTAVVATHLPRLDEDELVVERGSGGRCLRRARA